MSVKTLVYLVIVLLVINVAAIGTIIYERMNRAEMSLSPFGRPGGGPEHWRDGKGMGLRMEQMQHLRESRDSLRQELSSEMSQTDELRRKLFTEIGKDEPNREVINQLVEEMGRIQTEMHKRVIDNILRDGQILEPQQREFLLRMLEERALQGGGPDPGQRRRPGRWGN